MPPLLRNPLVIGCLLLMTLASSYLNYALNSGITITNDGSHFALFDSLVTTGNPELKHVRQFAFNDSALYEDRYYSDRNPGLALLTYGFYQVLRPLERWMHPLTLDPKMARRYLPDQEKRIVIVMLVPALSGTLLMLGMIALATSQSSPSAAAAVAALALMAGTLLLRYSTLFYSHITAAALLTWGLWLIFRFRQSASTTALAAGVGLLSLAVLVEHLLVFAFAPVLIYLAVYGRKTLLQPGVLAAVMIAGLLPMAVLMLYNWVCFDSPFSLAHFHHSTDTANHQLSTLFQPERILGVLQNLLLGAPREEVGRQDLTGLLSSSPFLLIVLIPLIRGVFNRSKPKPETLVLAASIVLIMLGASSFHSPYGGWDRDYRYFLVIVPLLAPFIAGGLAMMITTTENKLVRAAQGLAVAASGYLLWISVSFHFQHVRHAAQIPYPTPWINLPASLVNVSLFWLIAAACAAVLITAWNARQRLDRA
jgi:hypothetical protein